MKTKIRQGVWETNSSSTHSICIAKDTEINLPSEIKFEFGEFGWECDTLSSIHEKASYLYTGLIANDRQEDFDNIVKTLESKGIEVEFEEAISEDRSYTNSEGKTEEYKWWKNAGYVDHSNELSSFLDDICSDENKLLNYLFSYLSFIITSNDNGGDEPEINVNYPHDSYYKGN